MPLPRFTLRVALAVTAIVALFFGTAHLIHSVVGPVVPDRAISQLHAGMKDLEVERLLGRPTSVSDDGNWVYEKPLNPGWLRITFDDNRDLVSYDHD